ncbi:potassium channel family protein [Maridesulfovibrio frigidus]|uniref:potassium channel family protein n=1 Tax=Maridesulfovibrio frigidus TaxID=340956 RepID=UPI000689AF42|nr:potassium channel family protein [Maridesulfovibrio frigidus]
MFRLYKIFRHSPSKFTILLAFLVSQVLIQPLASESVFWQQTIYFYTYLVLLSAMTAIAKSRFKICSFIVLYVVSFVSSIMFMRTDLVHWLTASEVADMIILGLTVWGIMSFMSKQKRVTRDLISGAICVYMLIGAIWANGYSVCEIYHSGSFSGLDLGGTVYAARRSLSYFSYITMMTIGYGEMLPVTPIARALVMLQGLFGQMYLAVFVAGTIGMFLSQRDRERAIEMRANIRKVEAGRGKENHNSS